MGRRATSGLSPFGGRRSGGTMDAAFLLKYHATFDEIPARGRTPRRVLRVSESLPGRSRMEAPVNTGEEKRAMKTALKIVVGTVVLAVAMSLLPGLGDARKLKKVGLIVPGPIGNNGWSAAGYRALRKAAKKYGFQASHQENVNPPKAEGALRKFAEAGYDLVYAHMFVYSEAAARVAKAFPKTKFVVIHGTVRNKTNLVSYQTMTQGGGFMAGALAALVSKTGKIGALGGRPIPPIADAIAGYVAGAKHVRPGVKLVVEYTGDFHDKSLARKKALAMIRGGWTCLFRKSRPRAWPPSRPPRRKGCSPSASFGTSTPSPPRRSFRASRSTSTRSTTGSRPWRTVESGKAVFSGWISPKAPSDWRLITAWPIG